LSQGLCRAVVPAGRPPQHSWSPCRAWAWTPLGSKDYVARRTAEGKTKTEILRLKRYIAREAYPLLASSGPMLT